MDCCATYYVPWTCVPVRGACMQVQHAKLTASQLTLGVPCAAMLQLFRAAAEEHRREDLFKGMEELVL